MGLLVGNSAGHQLQPCGMQFSLVFFPIDPLRAHCESQFSLFLRFIFGSKSGTLRVLEWLIFWERMTRGPA